MEDARVLVHIDGDTKGIDKAAGEASNKLSKFKGIAKGVAGATAAVGTAAAATAKAFWNGANATAQYGDNIDKASQKLKLSSNTYQEMDYILQRNGASIDSLTIGMKNITKDLANFSNGSKDAAKKYEALGISMKGVNGETKNEEQMMYSVISSLMEMEDVTQRNAAAQEIFGRNAAELLPMLNAGSEEFDKLQWEARDYGMVMSEDAVKASAAFEDSLLKLQEMVKYN